MVTIPNSGSSASTATPSWRAASSIEGGPPFPVTIIKATCASGFHDIRNVLSGEEKAGYRDRTDNSVTIIGVPAILVLYLARRHYRVPAKVIVHHIWERRTPW